jgi:hypothetical protein
VTILLTESIVKIEFKELPGESRTESEVYLGIEQEDRVFNENKF